MPQRKRKATIRERPAKRPSSSRRCTNTDSQDVAGPSNSLLCNSPSIDIGSDSSTPMLRRSPGHHQAEIADASFSDSDASVELDSQTNTLLQHRSLRWTEDGHVNAGTAPHRPHGSQSDELTYVSAGTVFDEVCEFCEAFKFKNERSGFCCENGRVKLNKMPDLPHEMEELYSRRDYTDSLRSYNNAFAISSLGCNEAPEPGFSPTFKLYGKIYHRIGSLIPQAGANAKFLQIYFYDRANEISNRIRGERQLDRNVLAVLRRILSDINTYIKGFTTAENIARQQDKYEIVIVAKKNASRSSPYALPVSDEIAVLVSGDYADPLDVVIKRKGGEVKRIYHLNQFYDPTHYVLLLPYGTPGFTPVTRCTDGSKISICDFYKFHLQLRRNSFNHILRSYRLSQQYICDMWVKVESCKLNWINKNQAQLRAEKCKGLMDALDSQDNLQVGRRIILPATHYGSPRWYVESFHNAMAIVRHCGKPDLFITFTCNPKWPEITNSLEEGEKTSDCPDIVVRVFHLKWKQLKEFIVKKNSLGKVAAFIAVKEDQKRGLPHIHMLLTFTKEFRIRNSERLKELISAEIPHTGPLRNKVIKHMIHGPCGIIGSNQPCMRSGKCDKKFPIPFVNDETSMNANGVAFFQRRSPVHGGSTFTVHRGNREYTVDNRFVVSYSPTLLEMFDAHINVVKVNSVLSVKYAIKYTFKGSDMTTYKIGGTTEAFDEIEHFVTGRYIGTTSALWRMYKFDLMESWPPVQKLTVHMPDEQSIIFRETQTTAELTENGPPQTMLTAFFQLAVTDDTAKNLTYVQLPQYFTWNSRSKTWQKRKYQLKGSKNNASSPTVGRIPVINLNVKQKELYFLRMLLHHQVGPTSFSSLRTVDGTEHSTFADACQALGLLTDDRELIAAIQEASSHKFGVAIREMFAFLLMYSSPSNPYDLWEATKQLLCEDLKRRVNSETWTNDIYNAGLESINQILQENNMDLEIDFHFPKLATSGQRIPLCIQDQLNFDQNILRDTHETSCAMLTPEQRKVYDWVTHSVESDSGYCFSLNAPAGTGKTFVIETILAAVRMNSDIALATATSGIAALLLTKGQTLHSRCKVPLLINEGSMCNVSPRDATAELFRMAKLLIIDEVTMGHRFVFEAIDRTLRDIRGKNHLFGGLTVLLSGDWRQTLPVVKHGIRGDVVKATLKNSYIWQEVTSFKLTTNMRAGQGRSSDADSFARFLLDVGEDRIPHALQIGEDYIKVPADLSLEENSLEALINFSFTKDEIFNLDAAHDGCCIITPLNASVNEINDICVGLHPGEIQERFSADYLERNGEGDSAEEYPTEVLNSMDIPELSGHSLKLKTGCPIMLLRNLNPTQGHCNGSRYMATNIGQYVIEAVATTGRSIGKTVLMPRIIFTTKPEDLPFMFCRKQFPLKPCFALTINKAQGQSLKKVGIYLPSQVFSHGQLYVALSRAKNRNDVKIVTEKLADGNLYVRNIVYPEVL